MIEALNFFYYLNPYVAFFVVFFWGFGSLLLVGIKTHTIKTIILKNPAILIGDVLLLPLIGFIITSASQSNAAHAYSNHIPLLHFTIASIALFVTTFSAVWFKLVNRWWLPHGVFYWFMSYIILNFFISQGILFLTRSYDIVLSVTLLLVVIFLFFHFYLGWKFPKKFPNP